MKRQKSEAATELLATLRGALREMADAERAASMAAYLKSALPCLGVTIPRMRACCRAVFGRVRLQTFAEWRAAVLTLWREADYREERYAAIELCGHRFYQEWQTPACLSIYEEMIVSGAWWDLVDGLASHQVGGLVAAFPGELLPVMRRWMCDEDHWRRRTAILCQLGFKARTDRAFLTEAVLASVGERDFFLRKAIGWALREYAKTDPAWVIAFVRGHEAALSPLSRREALKGIERNKKREAGKASR